MRQALGILDAAALEPSGAVSALMAPTIGALLDARQKSGDVRLSDELARSARRGEAFSAVAKRTGFSARQLHRISLRAFGYSYSTLAQIERYRATRRVIKGGMPLAQAAQHCGYSDQAHMTREYSRWGGRTPGAVLSAALAVSDSFNTSQRGSSYA